MTYGFATIFAAALMASATALAQDQSSGQAAQTQPQAIGQAQGGAQQPVLTPRFTRFIQLRLRREGVLDKNPTGVWDADTVEAVQNFQEQRNIPATGQLDGLTILALMTRPTGPAGDAPTPQSGSSIPPAAARPEPSDQDQGKQRAGDGLNLNVAADAYVAGFTRGLEQGFRQAQLLMSIRQPQQPQRRIQPQDSDDE
jgi:hypothetical protein